MKPVEELSPRELQVLRLLVLGYSNAQISKMLYIAYATVKAHVQSILYKLNVQNRVQAAVVAACFLGINVDMIAEAAGSLRKRKNNKKGAN